VSIPVSKLGKLKTTVQMVAIIILLLGEGIIGIPYIDIVGQIALWIAAMLTLITGYAYCRQGFRHL
jgi:cardiolipin synthase (CMP-forming)